MTPTTPPTGDSPKDSGSETRRGHMVTKSYLKAWADKKNVIDVLDVQEERGFRSSISNASVVSYVYDPAVLTVNLEAEYGAIEDKGASAFTRLRTGRMTLEDQEAIVRFMDMHLHRGRYADRAGHEVDAVLMMTDGTHQDAKLTLGDMLMLTHQHPDTLRLTDLDLPSWTWKIYPIENLYTGDSAVLLWRPNADSDLQTVTFPLSPTQLLVIGEDLPEDLNMNRFIVNNCRRWIVGQKGSLPIGRSTKRTQRDPDPQP